MFSITYYLESPTTEAEGTGLPARPYASVLTARDPLGFGLITPFRRDGKGDFAAAGGTLLLADAIAQILGTRASNDAGTVQGELPWRPEFGSLVDLLRYKPIDDEVTRQLARVYTLEALRRWEPRVRLLSAQVTSVASKTGGSIDTLKIRIGYVPAARAPVSSVDLPPVSQVVLLTREAALCP